MTEIFEGIHQIRGEIFIRPVTGNRALILGIWPNYIKRDDEIWIADTTIIPLKRYLGPDWAMGLRADQVLCSSFDLSKLKEIL